MQQPWGGIVVVVSLLVAVPASAEPSALRVLVRVPPMAQRAAAKASDEGLALFRARCASCHGEHGQGDGPVAIGLTVKPRRFTDAFWQDSVDDEQLARAILEGGFAVKKSSAMPAHPDLKDKVAELIAVVRSLRSPTGSLAVEAVTADGAVIASVTVDARADGSGELLLPAMPPGAVALVMRVAGRSEPLCRVVASAPATLRGASCGAAPLGQEPR